MAKGTLRTKPLELDAQFAAVNDQRLRMTLITLSNRYNDQIRELIYRAYQDDRLASLWRQKRNSAMFEHGSKSNVHRKILEFPNAYIYDFVDTVLSTLYGPQWMSNKKALRHELVKPWWVVSKL